MELSVCVVRETEIVLTPGIQIVNVTYTVNNNIVINNASNAGLSHNGTVGLATPSQMHHAAGSEVSAKELRRKRRRRELKLRKAAAEQAKKPLPELRKEQMMEILMQWTSAVQQTFELSKKKRREHRISLGNDCENLLRPRLLTYKRDFGEPCSVSTKRTFCVRDPQSNYFKVRSSVTRIEKPSLLFNKFKALCLPHRKTLTEGGLRLLETPNAGGNSVWSEVMSFEVLNGLFGASLKRTEMEIKYAPCSKITDYSAEVLGHHVGVSVTRAMKYKGIFTTEDAMRLLKKKLFGVVASSEAVIDEHRWEKQILHVWAETDYIADIVERVYETDIGEEFKANTIVIVTIARDAKWIF